MGTREPTAIEAGHVHELALSTAIVNTVAKHADGRRVSLVSVRVGALRQVVAGSLAFYFEIVARDSVCEGARLELQEIPARLVCRACGSDWQVEVELPAFRCPACASSDVEVRSGEELEVESIEISEQEEPACIAPR
jgi:hydrogenase nickel incorporation protein HypA/HybF